MYVVAAGSQQRKYEPKPHAKVRFLDSVMPENIYSITCYACLHERDERT